MDTTVCTNLWEAYRCGKDPTAFDRLFDALHPGLLRKLHARFPNMPSGDVEDAATEAFVFLAMNPEHFDPSRAALPGFLAMIGTRWLTDRYRRAERQQTVSLDAPVANTILSMIQATQSCVEDYVLSRIIFGERNPRDELRPDVQAWLEAVLPVPRDRELFLVTADERLTVDAFALLFDMQTLPLEEQRREMKRHRDRVQKRVQRDGTRLWALIYNEPLPTRFTAPRRAQVTYHDR